MRSLLLFSSIIIFSLITLPAAAQQNNAAEEMPQGWDVRFDNASAGADDVTFTDKDGTLHFKADASGAAIYYKPDMKAAGSFTLQGTFTQHEETHHPEAYGLFIGGKDLQKKDQHYLYFLIHQGGEFLIKRRTGTDTQTIADWTSSDALHLMKASQPATNQLKISRDDENIIFWINGQKVKSMPASQLKDIDGIAGLRINHHLDVTVNHFMLGN